MKPTRDHRKIREWATRQGAVPAEIKPLKYDGEPTILYFLFGAAAAGTADLHPITWEDFFARFDLLGLSVAYDEDSPQFDIVKVEPMSSQTLAN